MLLFGIVCWISAEFVTEIEFQPVDYSLPHVAAAPPDDSLPVPPADPRLWIDWLQGSSPPIAFAMVVSSFCLCVSSLTLAVVLPIYLFSKDEGRVQRAGGLVKTTLGFVVAAGTGVIGTLSFV